MAVQAACFILFCFGVLGLDKHRTKTSVGVLPFIPRRFWGRSVLYNRAGDRPAHRTDARRVLYRWHPWSGRLVRVRDVVEKAGIARARCALDETIPDLWQEVPLWMFDRVACAGMRVEDRGQVDLATLSALASLVSDALGKAPARCTGWTSDDQDRGETHARLTRGASQARERIGAARSVRPGGEQRSGGHADMVRAFQPDTRSI